MLNQKLLSTLTVLYVEDDIATQKQMNEVLSEFFKKIYLAEDGKEGLKLFENYDDEIDIIISDINMPNLSGIEMLDRIRNKNSKIPIILSTGYSETSYLLDSIRLNVSEYLIKPYDLGELLTKIEFICQRTNEKTRRDNMELRCNK